MIINVKIYDDAVGMRSTTVELSKREKVAALKAEICKNFQIPPANQMMLYLGKCLEDEAFLLDYKIIENGTVILYVRANQVQDDQTPSTSEIGSSTEEEENAENEDLVETESKYYKIGDPVDSLMVDTGAWYEAIIIKILAKNSASDRPESEDDLIFRVKSAEHIIPVFEEDIQFNKIRPRSYYFYENEDLCPGLIVLANYNLDDKKDRGLWYNFEIKTVSRTTITGTILPGNGEAPIEKCNIRFIKEIMRIEKPQLLGESSQVKPTYIARKYPFYCSTCQDDRQKKCRDCGCKICRGKENWEKILLCDECNDEFHIYCLKPPLESIPQDDWYCPECKRDDSQIVKKGEIKITKKQANMPNKKSTSNRDWGRGNACAGRSIVCSIVPKHHFGPIPGIDVGTCWESRVQVSEAGVHRPLVSGIHGQANVGAYSLVLSGGYEGDIDNGTEFLYTGSGGRDLTGNKRVNKVHSSDQKLTLCNKALAMNCSAKFNEKGAEASGKSWTKGKPVRVVRSYKMGKRSSYAPKEGNRYDGIYKVVKYFPRKEKSGFIVWTYLLRRDDPTPAPWQKGGHSSKMIRSIVKMEREALKQLNKENGTSKPEEGSKRKRNTEEFTENKPKKQKLLYELPAEVKGLIKKDVANSKHWSECNDVLKDGKSAYLTKIQNTFICIVCHDLVFEPVTLECHHSFCKICLERGFKSKISSCPCCRKELDKDYKIEVNDNFSEALKLLLPGYGPGV